MKNRFLVVGLGRFGTALAESLGRQGVEVIAVDRNMASVDAVKDQVALAAELDATDPRALASIEAQTCAAAIVAIGEDFEAAVLTVAALKEAGVPKIIARARSAREGRILAAVGASKTIEIESEMGRQLGATLAAGDLPVGLPPRRPPPTDT